jgi:hypothetical protein
VSDQSIKAEGRNMDASKANEVIDRANRLIDVVSAFMQQLEGMCIAHQEINIQFAPSLHATLAIPKMDPPNIFVDVGPTNVKFDSQKTAVKRIVTTRQLPDGSIHGQIAEE